MQATASAAARRRLRQGLGLVVYRPRAAPEAVAGSETQAAADHGEAAARVPCRAGGAVTPVWLEWIPAGSSASHSLGVVAGLVPATTVIFLCAFGIGVAGTSPATTLTPTASGMRGSRP